MDNFGVIELASTRTTTAPGWAYVPDTTTAAAAAATTTAATPTAPGGNRKRAAAARNQGPAITASDLDARREARVRRELEALDRDCQRDASSAIPVRNPASRAQAKHTPNVRKILLSQKAFANHLDDFHAMQALAETQPGHANQYTYVSRAPDTPGTKSRRAAASSAASHRKQQQPRHQLQQLQQQQLQLQQQQQIDVDMQDVTHTDSNAPGLLLAPPPPETHAYPEEDTNPLLASRVPPAPSDEELRRLLAAPPLSYADAAARWRPDDTRYPPRRFCDVCGFWARVRCAKCGGGVCALDCLDTHRDECIARYGL